MAFCSKCGTQMGDGVKFCPSCGTAAGGAASAPKPATEKVGNIVKCPSCGASVPSMTAICPECGHEFRNMQTSGAIERFVNKLDGLNDKAALKAIESFVVPNTKEDILEFAIMASSQIKPVGIANSLISIFGRYASFFIWKGPIVFRYNTAWQTKIKQTYIRGKIALSSDKSALNQVEAIVADVKKTEKKNRLIFFGTLAAIVLLYVAMFVSDAIGGTPSREKETKRLIQTELQIESLIDKKDWAKAYEKVAELEWRSYKDEEEATKWEEKQQEFLSEIEAGRKAKDE